MPQLVTDPDRAGTAGGALGLAGSSPATGVTQAAAAREVRRGVIAVGGGKGGIGKTLLAANLGVHLAQHGHRVVLIDADLGGANLHTCLGVKPPGTTLSDFVTRKVEKLHDVVSPTPVHNLGLVSGALDVLGAANPKYTQKLRILREVAALDVDVVVIDLGGGTGFNILDFFLIADHGILTVVPEPTSIENAYRFIKAAYYRRLKTAELAWNLRPLVEEAMNERSSQGLKTPADLIAFVERRDPEGGAKLREELTRFSLKLVVNQTRTPEEERLGCGISDACRKYFGIQMSFLGTIPYDDSVWQSVRRRRPVLLEAPDSKASRAVIQIAEALGFTS
ncbi:MAG: P-loop NTPase [Deltaproteobacteria bacterium]|nr:P-loop NTPase [Deltaproteobacteria bacterium]